MLTVLKDRVTGNKIGKGVPLYFDKDSKRISDCTEDEGFNWKLGWEPEFQKADDLDSIPF